MFITELDSSEQELLQKSINTAPVKWRRSGGDRRLDSRDSFYEEKRALLGRRANWLEILSTVIFPRDSKIK